MTDASEKCVKSQSAGVETTWGLAEQVCVVLAEPLRVLIGCR